jgi:hypothetical protein
MKPAHSHLNLLSILGLALFAMIQNSHSALPDAEELAQRFRPYYKFSLESDNSPEPCRPCSWEWFATHSKLVKPKPPTAPSPFGGQNSPLFDLIATTAQLAGNPGLILSAPGGNILQSANHTGLLQLLPNDDAYGGEPWKSVIDTGAGLYAQVEDAGNNYVVITYWTLFAFNRTTAGHYFGYDHLGDITAVVVVYDRATDSLVRASYGMHGSVLESFDLAFPSGAEEILLAGKRVDGQPESVPAKIIYIPGSRRFQDGPAEHSPTFPPDLYLVKDPQTGKFEHLAVFHEWGSHEPWPNSNGSFTGAPRHDGNSISFLPKQVRFLGSFVNPEPTNAPFVLFNGHWGNNDSPRSPIFHKACFYPEGRQHNHFGIPESAFADRDPFANTPMLWPPPRKFDAVDVRLNVSCTGDNDQARVTVRWGHPNHDTYEYIPQDKVFRNQSSSRSFECPDRFSEFEIQTEGGENTAYKISIEFTRNNQVNVTNPTAIHLEHLRGATRDNDFVTGGVGATRSSPLNQTGEQNIKVDLQGNTHGTIH